jgi:hypothetical protein
MLYFEEEKEEKNDISFVAVIKFQNKLSTYSYLERKKKTYLNTKQISYTNNHIVTYFNFFPSVIYLLRPGIFCSYCLT